MEEKDLNKKIDKLISSNVEPLVEIVLTEEQKKIIIDLWRNVPKDEPPSLKELTLAAFPGLEFDGRSKQGKAVREFLATFGISPKRNVHEKIGKFELSVAEKEFIQNNLDIMKNLEISKTLWGDSMTPLSRQFIALKKFIDDEVIHKPRIIEDSINNGSSFIPPRTYNECLKLINKYNHDILSTNDISEQQKQGIYTLIRFLHSPRFIKTITAFKDDGNKELFLSEFIRATYDKPDLTVDETNLYISLAASYPLEQMALLEREALSRKLEEETENGRISQATVDAINSKNNEYRECQTRQEKLIKSLNGTRSDRIESQNSVKASLSSLIEYCRQERKREKIVAVADLQKKLQKECVEDYTNMDAVRIEIFGALPE